MRANEIPDDATVTLGRKEFDAQLVAEAFECLKDSVDDLSAVAGGRGSHKHMAIVGDAFKDNDVVVNDGTMSAYTDTDKIEQELEKVVDNSPDLSDVFVVAHSRSHEFGAIVPLHSEYKLTNRYGEMTFIFNDSDDISNMRGWSASIGDSFDSGAYISTVEEMKFRNIDESLIVDEYL